MVKTRKNVKRETRRKRGEKILWNGKGQDTNLFAKEADSEKGKRKAKKRRESLLRVLHPYSSSLSPSLSATLSNLSTVRGRLVCVLSNKSVQTIVVKQLRQSLYTPFHRRAPRRGPQREMSGRDRETDSRRSGTARVSRVSSPFILWSHLLPRNPRSEELF